MPRTSVFPPRTDFYSKHGAGLLADAITAVWARRGHSNVTAERYQMEGTGAWGVRSNLVDGLPPSKRGRGRPLGSTGPQLNPRKTKLVARS